MQVPIFSDADDGKTQFSPALNPPTKKRLFISSVSPGDLQPGGVDQYFTLERATSSPGVFDEEKFQWINSQHIKALAPAELARELTPISDPDRPQRFQPGIPGPGNAHSERLLPHSGDSRSGALLFPGPPAIRRKRCAKVFKVIDMTIHFIEGNQ